MRKFVFPSLILTALLSTNTFAANEKDGIFSCTATDGKQLTVKKVGNNYEYRHGQFSFKNPISQVVANSNSEIAVGSGFVTYTMELKHQDKSYQVGFLQARGSKTIEEPGVSIYKGEEYHSSVGCSLTKPITQNVDSTKIRRTGL